MRPKKISIISSIIIVILIISIVVLVNNILNKGSKEVKIAKHFIEELYDEDIINGENGFEISVEEDALRKISNKSSKIKNSVMVGSYAVDIDKEYKVLGFSNKNITEVVSEGADIISEDKAISLAEIYLNKITKDDYLFKEVKVQEDSQMPIYNINFYKLKDGHPYYKQEINVAINNITGKLEGYTNYPVDKMKYINDVNITEEEAKDILQHNLKNLDLNSQIINDPILYYINISDNEMVLAYKFECKVKNKDNKEDDLVTFVRADNKEVVNLNIEVAAR
ncbi:hypothetical protein [Clostridium tertium]|uniref:Peptidase propeptide and YPEB domain protein n=1 Tax=Clostridium tertium TaxID=1559 RepID=A0A6N3BL91_9CLOT